MKPHPRLRKTINWTGAAVTMLLVVVWIGSRYRQAIWTVSRPTGGYHVSLFHGRLGILCEQSTLPAGNGLDFAVNQFAALEWAYEYQSVRFRAGENWLVEVPLWWSCLPLLLLSATAWHLDARAMCPARLNLCPKCNYDRTGLAKDAVCPECGAPSK